MRFANWNRWSVAAGLMFTVLFLVGSFASSGGDGTVDEALRTTASFTTYLASHRAILQTGALLIGLSAVFFLWFLGSWYSVLRRAEGETRGLSVAALLGGVLWTMLLFLSGFLSVDAFSLANGYYQNREGARLGFTLGRALAGLGLSFLPLAVLLMATAFVCIRTRTYTAIGLLAAVLAVVFVFAPIFLSETNPLSLILLGLFLLWVIATSVAVLISGGEATRSQSKGVTASISPQASPTK